MKPRHHLYLDDALTAQLKALADEPGASKSAIVTDALRQYLKNRGGNEQDQAVLKRLDRISRQNERLQQEMDTLYHILAQFVRLYLNTTAHAPNPDDTARRIAGERFEKFIERVGKAIAYANANPSPVHTEVRADGAARGGTK